MKACKVFPSLYDTATLVCPYCGFYKDVNVAKFKNRVDPLKVRCKCRSTFAVSFEHRTAFRMETELHGYCIKLPEGKECSKTKIAIHDISPGGIGFSTFTANNFREGDKVRLKFMLDDAEGSIVTKNAIVRWTANGNCVGCEFCNDASDLNEDNKALGFYFMS
jgi:hypothetical protein